MKKQACLIRLAVLFASGLYFCPQMVKPFVSQAIRRLKTPPAGFNYQRLISAIEKGEELIPRIPGADNIFVYSPEGGWRNLVCLNAIPFYYTGPDALYLLALDLELAIKEGYIAWEEEFSVFNTEKLNGLSDEFLGKLGAERTIVPYWVFLNLRTKIGDLAQTRDFLANYQDITRIIPECCRVYGTEARDISQDELQNYGEYLNTLSEQLRDIFVI